MSKKKPDNNDTLRNRGAAAVRARFDEAHSKNKRKPKPPTELPSPNNPMAVAHKFVEYCCLHDGDADALTLRYWQGGWWAWRTAHWVEVEERKVRALLYAFTEHADYYNADGDLVPWLPNRKKIGDLLEALSGLLLPTREIEQPCWLDDRDIAGPMVATTNGLLDVTTRTLHPHTPLFFNVTSVPFAYSPRAARPAEWLAFLGKLWPHQSEQRPEIAVLGEWFGYVVSGRLDLHKIMLMVGPTRGGKGIIARILGALIGKRNVCGPTLNSLGGDFGLAPLIGKPLAVISDVRFVGRNGGVVVERLLSISGEDFLTVNVKYREQWTGKLPCRLHVMSNELPHLGDASSAIVGRLVLLPLTESWLGREDTGLEDRLREELPGILNWALEGLHRLTLANNNRFTVVRSADDAINTMRDLASPMRAYVRENCELDAKYEVAVEHLYGDFKIWAENNGHTKPNKQVFARDLRAAFPEVGMKRPRVKQPGDDSDEVDRVRFYVGIRLRKIDDG